MKLYFVRHGQTDANAKMTQGGQIAELDEPLNAAGVQQATEAADALKAIDFDAVVSSPLKRAVQTAEIINKYHNKNIQIDDAWREREAGAYIDATVWHDLFDFDKKIPVENGESLEDFFKRVQDAMIDLKSHFGPDSSILVVSHGGVQHVLYACANKLPLAGNMRVSPMKNCEIREYEL